MKFTHEVVDNYDDIIEYLDDLTLDDFQNGNGLYHKRLRAANLLNDDEREKEIKHKHYLFRRFVWELKQQAGEGK